MEQVGDRVVVTRGELAAMLAAALDRPSEAADALAFVDSAMALQNDAGRPVYVLAVSDDVSADDVRYIRDGMAAAGLAALLVPRGALSYVAELTPGSAGNTGRNMRERYGL